MTGGDDPVILDIDASLVEIHSENKDGTAPNFKGGFGFHPMFCFADATGEALAARLRPGNAAANDAADNLEVLDDAITQLPADVAAGHCVDDDLGEVPPPGDGAVGLGGLHSRVRGRLPVPQHRLRSGGPPKKPLFQRLWP